MTINGMTEHGVRRVIWRSLLVAATMASTLAGAASPGAAQVLASADGETTGVRIDILELKRTSGDTLMLKFRLINDTAESVSPYLLFDTSDVRGTHLIDAVGKKKYMPLTDSQKACVCSGDLSGDLPAGKSLNLWARFPAPPAETSSVSVVFPHFIPTDVPVGN